MTERICVAATENGSGEPYSTTLIDPEASSADSEILIVGAVAPLVYESLGAAEDIYEIAQEDAGNDTDAWDRARMMCEYISRVADALEDEDGMLVELRTAVTDMLKGGPIVCVRIRTADERRRDITIAPPARAREDDARVLRLDLFDPAGEVGWV